MLLKELAKENKIDLITYANIQHQQTLVLENIHIRIYTLKDLVKHILSKFFAIRTEFNPEVVLAHTHIPAFLSCLLIGKSLPVIFDFHGLVRYEQEMSSIASHSFHRQLSAKIHGFIELIALKYSSRILVVSSYMAKYALSEAHVKRKKISYITNGVRLGLFKSVGENEQTATRKEYGLGNVFVAGYIGGTQKWQGVGNLIEAIKFAEDPTFLLLLVGCDKEYQSDRIVSIPRMPRVGLPKIYSICDAFILPRPLHRSTLVAAPTKFAEYAAIGRPILATDVGDAAIFVRKYNCGIVVPSNSSRDLWEGITRLQSTPKSELLTMGKNARIMAEKEFNWSVIGRRLQAAIRNTLQRNT